MKFISFSIISCFAFLLAFLLSSLSSFNFVLYIKTNTLRHCHDLEQLCHCRQRLWLSNVHFPLKPKACHFSDVHLSSCRYFSVHLAPFPRPLIQFLRSLFVRDSLRESEKKTVMMTNRKTDRERKKEKLGDKRRHSFVSINLPFDEGWHKIYDRLLSLDLSLLMGTVMSFLSISINC